MILHTSSSKRLESIVFFIFIFLQERNVKLNCASNIKCVFGEMGVRWFKKIFFNWKNIKMIYILDFILFFIIAY